MQLLAANTGCSSGPMRARLALKAFALPFEDVMIKLSAQA